MLFSGCPTVSMGASHTGLASTALLAWSIHECVFGTPHSSARVGPHLAPLNSCGSLTPLMLEQFMSTHSRAPAQQSCQWKCRCSRP